MYNKPAGPQPTMLSPSYPGSLQMEAATSPYDHTDTSGGGAYPEPASGGAAYPEAASGGGAFAEAASSLDGAYMEAGQGGGSFAEAVAGGGAYKEVKSPAAFQQQGLTSLPLQPSHQHGKLWLVNSVRYVV